METGSALEDRDVLLRLFKASGGASWKSCHGWATNNYVGGWFGVTTNAMSRVVEIYLTSNNLRGEIPKELGNLQALEVLFLGNNALTGNIPKELGNLRRLKVLYLQGNRLTGEIPKEIGRLVSVKTLDISRNQLRGGIPRELGNLPAVQMLVLSSNKLSGEIPEELGDIATLERLNLAGNELSEVPMAFLQALRKRDGFDKILNVADNASLRPPQAVIDVGVDQAIFWWEGIEQSGEGISNRLKMVFVGLAGAGKTTLVRNITGRAGPERLDRTVGIEITEGWKPLEDGPLEVSVWDFAGQADYYASHQIFLTDGALFLLVVDLQAMFVEVESGIAKHGDPRGRVYRWLEMLHLRVPGAAVALVGTHTDAAEFEDPADLDKAVNHLQQLIARYLEDKSRAFAKLEAAYKRRQPGPMEEYHTVQPEMRLDGGKSPPGAARSLCIHNQIFRTALNPASTTELQQWIGKAASLIDCPPGFRFPAIGVPTPQHWIDANSAMDGLMTAGLGNRYVTWDEAVTRFEEFMGTKGTPIRDSEGVLLAAMRLREAEGGVLLSLKHDPPRLGESAGMLYLDPTWLIEVIRRLTDHNLVDPANEGTLKNELWEYSEELAKKGEEKNSCPTFETLWNRHKSYRRSGTLDLHYLRYLWLHRKVDNGLELNLNDEEFKGVVETMERLLVLFRVTATDETDRGCFVVPARLPELGDELVLENASMSLGNLLVRTRCSFRQSYAPPGLIGRFLAFASAHIKEARECWQHGAHLIWVPGAHDVLVYETHFVESSDAGRVTYPGLVLCVKGSSPAARGVLDSLVKEVRRLLEDKLHGYPGLSFGGFGDTDVIHGSDLSSDLREFLDTGFERLEALVRRVAGVTSQVLEAFFLAAEEDNQYPRLLILKPEDSIQPTAEAATPEPRESSVTLRSTGRDDGHGAAAAPEAMRRETWMRWIRALAERRQFRLVFICEHDMTEVRCGPAGNGYLIEDLPKLVKACLPLLQVTLLPSLSTLSGS